MSAATTPTDYVRAPRDLVQKAHRLAQSAQTTNDHRTGKIAMEIEAPLAALLAQPGELTAASTWREIRERINLPPRPEWTSANTVNVNAKLKGWESFFEGRPRDDCPFPPARPDLKTAYQAGWDAAQSAPPRPGEIRTIDGKRCRFIERELEGDKWEVLGPADADPAPAPEGGSKLKPATLKEVLLAAAQTRDLHMSDRLALEWCAEQPEALAALKAAAEGRDVIGAGGPMDTIIDGQVSDAMIRRMVEAHDTEEAAQKGEPSPWREDLGAVDDPAWVSERMTAMRCAVEAVRFDPEETPSAYLFRVNGKWELSIVDPCDSHRLKPEDVVQVPISAQPTATFVAKAKHLLDLAEAAEDKALEGDEGCVWPVEALRAAYAALPFVMTITLGCDHAED